MIRENFIEAQNVLQRFAYSNENYALIERAGNVMATAIKRGNKILSCGNGGSLCDAMHFAEELTGRFRKDRKPLAAFALGDAAHITCVSNDFGFDYIFSRYVDALANSGDVLLVISTSGNSMNIINAVKIAKEKDVAVIALTGNNGGRLAALCDIEIRVPHHGYSDRIQEVHIKIIHALVQCIEMSVFAENQSTSIKQNI